MTCPICKRNFDGNVNNEFNEREFMHTIAVDNECFYSDHLVDNTRRMLNEEERK